MDRSGIEKTCRTRESRSLSGPDGTTLAVLCWNLVKHPLRAENTCPVANFPHLSGHSALDGNPVWPKLSSFMTTSGESG
jgi:hypothetical protein